MPPLLEGPILDLICGFEIAPFLYILRSYQHHITMPGKDDVDYSLYLVTGRELLPPGVDYYESLEASIRDGGVTIVQLREKTIETSRFLDVAKRSLTICDRVSSKSLLPLYSVYLLFLSSVQSTYAHQR
jgi:hypothetical protein